MSEHTPGHMEWLGDTLVALHPNGYTVHILTLEGPPGAVVISVANRDRIAATWNACAGMADPEAAIPALVEALRGGLWGTSHAWGIPGRKQRGLAALLERAADFIRHTTGNKELVITADLRRHADTIRAALAPFDELKAPSNVEGLVDGTEAAGPEPVEGEASDDT